MAIESKMRGPIGARPAATADGQKGKSWVLVMVFLLVVVAIGAWYYWSQGDESADTPIVSGEYQAVFLDNGQVYFGKLDQSDEVFFTLTDVFYLQSGVAVTETANLALTKLGAEAHGPEDRMQINVDHVLFIEDMKSDSKVVQAIEQYKNK
jgi:hypothetical protein